MRVFRVFRGFCSTRVMVEREGRFFIPSWSGYESIGIPAERIPFAPEYIEVEDREVRTFPAVPVVVDAYIRRPREGRAYIRFSTGVEFPIPERVADWIEREIGSSFPVRIFATYRPRSGRIPSFEEVERAIREGREGVEYYYPIPRS